jgi:hypothetical protein
MDVTQALKDTENSLRDFIASELEKKFGNDWPEKCGLLADRIEKWKERKAVEAKRQVAGAVDERLIYYADFYDLKTLLHKNWSGPFSEALGDWKTMEVWLSELEKLRDPDAHRRELMPHQKHLALGIAGEIRTRLVRYRSKQETGEDYFPRIEIARDNYGNVYPQSSGSVKAKTILRPGDTLEFVVTASDPMGEELEYAIGFGSSELSFHMPMTWQNDNLLVLSITDKFIGRDILIAPVIRSHRPYHASTSCDDMAGFTYDILPPRAAHK